MHTAENACRNMQSIIESHTHCLPTHPVTWWCYPVPCKKWLLELADAQHATLVPNYGQNKNVLEASGQNKNALELPKCVRDLPSHTFICTTGWSRKHIIFLHGANEIFLLWSHGTKPSRFAPSIGLAQAAQVHGIQEFYGSNPEPPLKLVKPQLWVFPKS